MCVSLKDEENRIYTHIHTIHTYIHYFQSGDKLQKNHIHIHNTYIHTYNVRTATSCERTTYIHIHRHTILTYIHTATSRGRTVNIHIHTQYMHTYMYACIITEWQRAEEEYQTKYIHT